MRWEKRIRSIFGLSISILLNVLVLKLFKKPSALLNYYLFNKVSYLNSLPNISLKDVRFAMHIFEKIYILVQIIFILSVIFPIINFFKNKIRIGRELYDSHTNINDMGEFFNKPNEYFIDIKQYQRYTIPMKDELSNEKMKELLKSKYS